MPETNAASDGVDTARKKVGPTTSPSTNMEMLLNDMKSHLSTMSSEGSTGGGENRGRCSRHKKASGDSSHEGGLARHGVGGDAVREKGAGDREGKISWTSESLSESNTRPGSDRTLRSEAENASMTAKENIEEVKMLDEALT